MKSALSYTFFLFENVAWFTRDDLILSSELGKNDGWFTLAWDSSILAQAQ